MSFETGPSGHTIRPVSLRLLTADDAHVLERVRPGLFAAPLEPSRIFACLATGLNTVAVAVQDGQVVACGSGTVLMSLSRPDRFLLTDLVTHLDLRGQGIGGRLVTALADAAADRGCTAFEAALAEAAPERSPLFAALGPAEITEDRRVVWPLA